MVNVKPLVVMFGGLKMMYQIKAILKEYMKDELKEFNELYKKLAEKMLPMVYELGFLRK